MRICDLAVKSAKASAWFSYRANGRNHVEQRGAAGLRPRIYTPGACSRSGESERDVTLKAWRVVPVSRLHGVMGNPNLLSMTARKDEHGAEKASVATTET